MAAECATLIQVSHPRRLLSESIRKRIDREFSDTLLDRVP
jgi:hypothetical protein